MEQSTKEPSKAGRAGVPSQCCSGCARPDQTRTTFEESSGAEGCNNSVTGEAQTSAATSRKNGSSKDPSALLQCSSGDGCCLPLSCSTEAETCCISIGSDHAQDTQPMEFESLALAKGEMERTGCCAKDALAGQSSSDCCYKQDACDNAAPGTTCCDTEAATPAAANRCQRKDCEPAKREGVCIEESSDCCAPSISSCDKDTSFARDLKEEDICCSGITKSSVRADSSLDLCCTDSSKCECSDDCIAEYAAKLCAEDTAHSSDGCNSDYNGREQNLQPQGKIRVQPCKEHLEMASAYANDTLEDTQGKATMTAEARYISNISHLIRKCFCNGPRPFLFPGRRTCCMVRRERAERLNSKTERHQSMSKKSTEKIRPVVATAASDTDLEMASAGNNYTLALGVVGMTCTGCESKLRDILESHPGVSDVKTSFILNRADLVYDSTVMADISEITSRIKKRTGFTCTVLRTGLASSIAGESFMLRHLDPDTKTNIQAFRGVNSVVRVGKDRHQVFYEPRIVGIRDILKAIHSSGGRAELSANSSEVLAKRAEDRHWYLLIGQTLSAAVLTIPVLVFAWSSFAVKALPSDKIRYSAASMTLATMVQVLASSIYKHSIQVLFYQREIDMDVLVVLSITSAYIYSLVAFGFEMRNAGSTSALGRPVFETSTLLITLIKVGRLLTLWIRRRARNLQELGSSQSEVANVIRKVSPSGTAVKSSVSENGPEIVDSTLLHYGDVIRGIPSEQIVTDGIIVEGIAEIDESQITGENAPVTRSKKSHVFAGSKIINGTIDYRVTRLVSENTLSIVQNLVSTAASSRTKTQQRADQVAAYLTPVILGVAAIDFLIWALVNVFVRRWGPTPASINALTFTISVLAISCPCALALAVPMILTVASSVGVKKGVLFKSGAALDAGERIRHVVFDKTGTLTTGKLTILKEAYLGEDQDVTKEEIRRMTAIFTQGNKHPVSQALNQYVEDVMPGINITSSSEPAKLIIGKGVEITTEDCTIRGGSPAWLGIQDHRSVKEMIDSSLTVFCLTRNENLLAVYGLSSTIRPEAAEVISKLCAMNITPHLLSGDNPPSVSRVASALGLDNQYVRSNCQPDDKAAYIRDLQESASPDKVAFIGDGTNDAPALSQADLGICMSNAADIAADAADVGILRDSLRGLVVFLELSKRANRRVRLNLAWAVIYNIFAVLFAAGVFEAVGFRIQPSYAGVGEMVSLLPVIGISLSLNVWLWE